MSNTDLPPQKSPIDTSNWDDKTFSAPISKRIEKVSQRKMIADAVKPNKLDKKRKNEKTIDIEKIDKQKAVTKSFK